MDIAFVEKLIGLVENSRLAELEYSADGKRIRLSKAGFSAGSVLAPASPAAPAVPAAPASPLQASAPAAAPAGLEPQTSAHRIVAGLGGTFFTRPAPGEAPFVKVGDTVEEGQALGIIEAMKMLNSVESDIAGVLTEVCVEDGAAIASGTAIFLIQPR